MLLQSGRNGSKFSTPSFSSVSPPDAVVLKLRKANHLSTAAGLLTNFVGHPVLSQPTDLGFAEYGMVLRLTSDSITCPPQRAK